MDQPVKVSAIIPVYNSSKHLEQCLDSLLNQTLTEIEVICVDDGSTDNSLEILKRYEQKSPKISILQQKNLYAGAARNRGMDLAKGKYLVFLDSDDFCDPLFLELQYNKCEEHSAEISICGGDRYDESTHLFESAEHFLRCDLLPDPPFNYNDPDGTLFMSSIPAAWNKMYQADFIKQNNLRFQSLQSSNDVYFTCSALSLAKKITYLDKSLYHYRVGQENNLQSLPLKNWKNSCKAHEALLGELKRRNLYSALRWDFINRAAASLDWHLTKTQDNAAAYSEFCAALDETYIELFEFNTGKEFETKRANCLKRVLSKVAIERQLNKGNLRETKVSIVVSLDGNPENIKRCLNSIFKQSLTQWEVICTGNNLSNKTLSFIDELSQQDPRITFKNQSGSSLNSPKNYGIKNAKGEYVSFISADDYYCDSNTLNNLYQAAKTHTVNICSTYYPEKSKTVPITPDTKRKKKWGLLKQKALAIPASHPEQSLSLFLFRTKFLRERFLYFSSYENTQNRLFLATAASSTNKFYQLKQKTSPIAVNETGPATTTNPISLANGICDILELAKKHNLNKLFTITLCQLEENYLADILSYPDQTNRQFTTVLKRLKQCIISYSETRPGASTTAISRIESFLCAQDISA